MPAPHITRKTTPVILHTRITPGAGAVFTSPAGAASCAAGTDARVRPGIPDDMNPYSQLFSSQGLASGKSEKCPNAPGGHGGLFAALGRCAAAPRRYNAKKATDCLQNTRKSGHAGRRGSPTLVTTSGAAEVISFASVSS